MEFALSEEQQELASTVRAVLAKHADSRAMRAAAESETGYDVELWRLLCEQIGVAALAVPEGVGGAGFDVFETLVVLEELGRSLAPSPLLASLVASQTLLALDDAAPDSTSDSAVGSLLARIAEGAVATLAWSGTRGPGRDETVRVEGGRLHGVAGDVHLADVAEILLVVADDGRGALSLHLVDPDADGLERAHTPTMDTTLRLGTLTLDGCPATALADDATSALARAALVGTVGVSALQVGCAERALDMTVAYTKERTQFGRPIGSFQALKHRMADLLVLVEMARSASWAAGHAVSVAGEDAGRLVAVAGSYCAEALHQVAAETVQLHGGIAITWEHDAQLVFKRAHALGQLFGAPHEHRRALVL